MSYFGPDGDSRSIDANGDDLKTPDAWLAELHPGARVLDPDGWRGKNGRPWSDPITREEFHRRFALCTVTGPTRPVTLAPSEVEITRDQPSVPVKVTKVESDAEGIRVTGYIPAGTLGNETLEHYSLGGFGGMSFKFFDPGPAADKPVPDVVGTVYVAMIDDRHTDTEAHVFTTRAAAIAYAERWARETAWSPEDFEVQDPPPDGWLYLAHYGESNSVWVVATEVQQ